MKKLLLAITLTLGLAVNAQALDMCTLPSPLLLRDGSAAAPSLTFLSDPDTGLWHAGENIPAIAVGGETTVVWQKVGTGTAGRSVYQVVDPTGGAGAAVGVFANGSTTTQTNLITEPATGGFYSTVDLLIGAAVAGKKVRLFAGGLAAANEVGQIQDIGITGPVPVTETITAGATITANACGGLKRITAAGAVSTDTTNTFTAPAAANAGCKMDVCNEGANAITLDDNANFHSPANADFAVAAGCCIPVASSGAGGFWRATATGICND